MSVEIALEGVLPRWSRSSWQREMWGGGGERYYMEEKEKWESEPINIYVMSNSVTSPRLFIGQLSKPGENCLHLSRFIRDVRLLKMCEMKTP